MKEIDLNGGCWSQVERRRKRKGECDGVVAVQWQQAVCGGKEEEWPVLALCGTG